jgi:hypothetical protein
MLTNMHCPTAEGTFCDKYGNALKPSTVQDYNRHMGYVEKNECMANSYSIIRRTWKWVKKLLSFLGPFNSEQFYSQHSWLQTIPQEFQTALVRDLVGEAGRWP